MTRLFSCKKYVGTNQECFSCVCTVYGVVVLLLDAVIESRSAVVDLHYRVVPNKHFVLLPFPDVRREIRSFEEIVSMYLAGYGVDYFNDRASSPDSLF